MATQSIIVRPTADAVRRYGGKTPYSVDESKSGVIIGIYGPGGAGKTTAAASICRSEFGKPALYLNARGNPQVIRSYGDDIQVVDIDHFKEIEPIRQDILKDGHCPFNTVILDNVSDMWSINLRDRYGATAEVQWQQHSASTADLLSFYRNWCDLSTHPQLHMNVIFVMWETPEKRTIRGQEIERSELAFNKALQVQIPGIVTWLGRLYIVSGPPNYTRCLDFRPIETQQQSKFQVDPDDVRTKAIPMEQYNPDLSDILNCIKSGAEWPTAKHARPTAGAAGAGTAGAGQQARPS